MTTPVHWFSQWIQTILQGKVRGLAGLWGASRALLVRTLLETTPGRLLWLVPHTEEAEARAEELRDLLKAGGPSVWVFPPWETLPYDPFPPPPGIVHQRFQVLEALMGEDPVVVVAPVGALLQRLLPRDLLTSLRIPLEVGQIQEPEALAQCLQDLGYESVGWVSRRGEMELRGGILDVYSPVEPYPVRIEFFGDEIVSLRWFHPETQRTVTHRERVVLYPPKEPGPVDLLAQGVAPNSLQTLLDYLQTPSLPAWLLLEEPERVAQREGVLWEKAQAIHRERTQEGAPLPAPEVLYAQTDSLIQTPGIQTLFLSSLPVEGKGSDWVCVPLQSTQPITELPPRKAGEEWLPLQTRVHRIQSLRKTFRVVLACATPEQAQRIQQLLQDYGVPSTRATLEEVLATEPAPEDPVRVVVARLSGGFLDPQHQLALILDEEIFGRKVHLRRDTGPRPRGPARPQGIRLTRLEELQVGDPVVHVQHGVGRYEGLCHLRRDGMEGDFLKIRYAGGDTLYVPVDRLQWVQRYLGPEGHPPPLDRLGGSRWERTRKRVQKAVESIARDLLELYAERQVLPGHAFSPDGPWMREIEATFEYEETPDQWEAIEAVKRDMEQPRPMDRLVCGDVGYGKTEVAIRAAAKAVLDGKQVAVLVPTTLLAQQHLETFRARFAPLPVRVEVLSRFRSSREQRKVLEDVAQGKVDILIGTHRLLQKDVRFRDLGLLIVDEEQRFGVAQKERLKQLRKTVDVLTLTATPIPRTLQMGLSGIRDMSVIQTAPADRLPVRTILAPFDPRIIREAILRELDREGQVFFVHNRVQTLPRMEDFLRRWVPEAQILVAHGQMPERQLEEVMRRFQHREADVLLCTAIVESGLDLPNVNTILIDQAHRFGLADLYQLRGRVGRSGRQAYAYFLIPPQEALGEEAQKRLRAIQELTELGSAFQLALRDLEIRGAGNLLGRAQSGHIAAVGLDLYLDMLEKAVQRLQGKVEEAPPEPSLNLKVRAFIPETYVPASSQRLSLYRRLASVADPEEVEAFREEFRDRYGPLPQEVETLLRVVCLRVLARRARVVQIQSREALLVFHLDPRVPRDPGLAFRLLEAFRDRIRFPAEFSLEVQIRGEDPLEVCQEVLEWLQGWEPRQETAPGTRTPEVSPTGGPGS